MESQLIQGSSVFHLLGYQYTDDGVLYLDEPVDPDKVARVALDCLTAYVECQVTIKSYLHISLYIVFNSDTFVLPWHKFPCGNLGADDIASPIILELKIFYISRVKIHMNKMS